MTRTDLLVELGTEELPPKALLKLRDAFARGLLSDIDAANLPHGEVLSFATPRRLAVLVKDLASEQPTQKIENRGPPLRLAFDGDGLPTKAAKAFAAKCGVPTDELQTLETDKGEWLFYSGEVAGAQTSALLGDMVAAALAQLPIPKRMRWGAGSIEFVRPVHWLVMLLGDAVVDATVLGQKAGRLTFGHRFHKPEALEIGAPADYVELLRDHGSVIADFEERRGLIEAAAHAAAKELGGEVVLEPDVLDEVCALVEWPVPVVGRFPERFLRLPPEVLVSTLQDHQRYFPVQNDGQLLAAFVATSNIESRNPDEVRRGNERVVLPRLADAAFFWDQDAAKPLAERQADLKQVVYQQGLGSLYDKSERVANIAATLAEVTGADAKDVARAAALSRTDLLTDMVGEFPELQGRMGYYYAINDGEAPDVAAALEEQYLPRQAGDRLATTRVGMTLAIADRLDTLAGIFALGKKPSGNKDPFGLRRQALGLVRNLVENGIDVDLRALLLQAVELQPRPQTANKKKPQPTEAVVAAVYEFIIDRMRAWYVEGQAPGFAKGDVSVEMFQAVHARAPGSPLDFHQRLIAVQHFMQHESADSLAAANKRIANILKQAADRAGDAGDAPAEVDQQLFAEAAETQLHKAVSALLPGHATALAARDYEGVLSRLSELREPVDGYFDQVMVMTDNDQQRLNRLAQLGQLRKLFLDVADISCISAP